jgi:Mn-dependent DtxR family transcriptional regulator
MMALRIAMLQPSTSGFQAAPRTARTDTLRRRIVAEFHEMPGLVLSVPQVSRLLGLQPEVCERMLAELAADGFLRRRPSGSYGRA